ncbi:sema domain protein [Ancylostoma caninum]|uniref:Sema domain protein n=1 Tax=Ancylostoma caninum TaxID=29170 RepID=A0A368FAE6_ANCCA|nr:sema domain protein [Ancylostoma caninum]
MQGHLCDNYIRTFYLAQRGFVVCGTHGLNPTCANFLEGERSIISCGGCPWNSPRRIFAGDGLAPHAPDVIAPFLFSGRYLYTANAPDYSSTELLLMRKDPLKSGTADMLRTGRGESQTDGAQFVKLTENKNVGISAQTNTENRRKELTRRHNTIDAQRIVSLNEVLAFFSEPPSESEGCGLRRVARIGRVCRDDTGGTGKHQHEWTSFVKSRLDCAIEGKDQDTLYFNQLASVTAGAHFLYGAFRSQLAGLGSSAICAYSRATVSQTMAGAFRNRKANCPRANDTYEHTYIRNNPLLPTNLAGRHSTVFFIATDQGKVFKVIKYALEAEARHVSSVKAVEASSPIVSLTAHIERRPNQQTAKKLLILTPTQPTRVLNSRSGKMRPPGGRADNHYGRATSTTEPLDSVPVLYRSCFWSDAQFVTDKV